MPFASQAQRGYLFANEPAVAAEFAAATPKGKKLPYKVKPKADSPTLPAPLTKKANPPMDAGGIALNNQLKTDSLHRILGFLGVAAAAGAGTRALVGRSYLFGSPASEVGRPGVGSTVVPIPYPMDPEEERRRRRLGLGLKTAGIFDRAPGEAENRLRGDAARESTDIPWYWPGVAMASVGGLAGGYGLMNWWMDRKRKVDLSDEVEDSRKEYQKALLGQYPGIKTAGEKTAGDLLGEELDGLCDDMEKSGEGILDTFISPQTQGKLTGAGLTMAGMLALGTGYLGYRWAKDRSQAKLVEEAIRQRERQRMRARPPEVMAIPVPVSARGAIRGDPDDILDKVANTEELQMPLDQKLLAECRVKLAMAKESQEKQSYISTLVGAGLGALIGLAQAREGKALQGAGAGALRGGMTGIGIGVGGAAGLLGGYALDKPRSSHSFSPAMAGGLGVGMGVGGYGGYRLGKALTPTTAFDAEPKAKPAPKIEKKKQKPETKIGK